VVTHQDTTLRNDGSKTFLTVVDCRMADGTSIFVGVLAGAALAVGGLWLYQKYGQQAALPDMPSMNPLPLLPGTSSTALARRRRDGHNQGRRVAYRAEIGLDPYYETIAIMGDGTAVLFRRRRPIARFQPTPYQLAKIRAGYGEVFVYRDQLTR
jgi:hypothetical protein